jgi:hypothetical protein
MSLNICIDCNFEKKKCQCVVPTKKISWWRKILNWFK